MSTMLKNGINRLPSSVIPPTYHAHFANGNNQLASPKGKLSANYQAQDKHNRDQTDLMAFKEKYKIDDNNPPISCFRLITIPSPKPYVSLDDLNQIEFSVLPYSIAELSNFSKMILDSSPERKSMGKTFNLPKLISLVAENYHVTAYHNFSHAFSLQQLLWQAYNRCGKLRGILNERQWFFVFIAALMHDLRHPGTINAFQIKSKSKFAQEAGEVAVLEKMHLNQFWTLLKKNSQVNFLQGYASNEVSNIKNLITRMVFSTDVASHFKNVEILKHITKEPVLQGKQSLFVVEQIFHACDIGNPCLNFENYINWGALVSFQFNEITRREKQMGLQMTSFLQYQDLKKFYNGQIGFCKGLVLPLWKQLNVWLPGITEMHTNILKNIAELEKRRDSEQSNE